MNLAGRVAVVTGAGRGIGAAICAALAADGAAVAVSDLDAEAADAHAAELAAGSSARVIGVELDVTNLDSVRSAVSTVARELGPVDVLVNNAGIDCIEPFIDSTEQTWDRLIATNLKGPIRCARIVLDDMIERKAGRIINIASDAGKVGSSGEVVYSATKGGIIAFTKALARETAAQGITVNCVCPGPTNTALLDQVAEANRKLYDSLARAVPLRRIGEPSDVAPLVAFLASDAASYMTGQAISVSGGLTMS